MSGDIREHEAKTIQNPGDCSEQESRQNAVKCKQTVTVILTLTMRTDMSDEEIYVQACEDPPAFFGAAEWTFTREGHNDRADVFRNPEAPC